jgi:Cu(I)/Ag(I) efflux system protein CusF
MHKGTLVGGILLALASALAPNAGMAQSAMIDGQVTKIDESAGKITLKHGPIKKLGMDEGMTMVFRAQDPAMLKQVKVGDKVKFDADRVNGQFTVTKIEKAK